MAERSVCICAVGDFNSIRVFSPPILQQRFEIRSRRALSSIAPLSYRYPGWALIGAAHGRKSSVRDVEIAPGRSSSFANCLTGPIVGLDTIDSEHLVVSADKNGVVKVRQMRYEYARFASCDTLSRELDCLRCLKCPSVLSFANSHVLVGGLSKRRWREAPTRKGSFRYPIVGYDLSRADVSVLYEWGWRDDSAAQREGQIHALDVDADRNMLFGAAYQDAVVVWDRNTGEQIGTRIELRTRSRRPRYCSSLFFDERSYTLLIGCSDHGMIVKRDVRRIDRDVDMFSPHQYGRKGPDSACVTCIRRVGDDMFVSGSSNASVSLWRASSSRFLASAHVPGAVASVACVTSADRIDRDFQDYDHLQPPNVAVVYPQDPDPLAGIFPRRRRTIFGTVFGVDPRTIGAFFIVIFALGLLAGLILG